MAYNLSEGGAGALGGSGIGGSIGGPIGAATGGLLGALSGFFGNDKLGKISTLSKDQKKVLSQLLSQLTGSLGESDQQSIDYLMQLINPDSEAVNQFAAPYQTAFEQETVPMLAERFAGMGGGLGGGLSSSGFGQSLSSAGANLQQTLAALKAGLGQQAASQLMSTYGNRASSVMGIPSFAYTQPQMGFGQGLLGAFGQSGFPGLGGR